MVTRMNLQTEVKIDKVWFELYQERGLYLEMNFEQYQRLKTREARIAGDPAINRITLEEVIADFKRNGSIDAQLLPKTFVEGTLEDSRNAYVFGYQSLVTYFATGTAKDNPKMEFGLISAHIPGNPGGGGWGLNGTRKLQLVKKPLLGWKKEFDPDEWITHSIAWVYEDYNGELHHNSKKNENISGELWRDIRKSFDW